MNDAPEQKLLYAVKKHNMIQNGDDVMVCVSGGADSMALLSLFARMRKDLGINGLTVCHFNHGLRGKESDEEQRMVLEYCAALDVPCVCENGNMNEIPRPKGESLESFARALRYDFFERAAKRFGAVKIVVAHNKNDVAETALFNITRGAGIKGARGIPPVRDNIIRPLIDISRDEIEQYCRENGIEYATDSSNKSKEYSRNRIRLDVIPELEKINGNAVDNIARFCALAGEISDYIEAVAAEMVRGAKIENGYDIKSLLENGDVVAKYSLKHIIEHLGVSPSENNTELCFRMLNGGLNEVQLAENVYLRAENGMLFSHGNVVDQQDYCMDLKVGLNKTPDGIGIEIAEVFGGEIASFIKSSKNILNNSIDCDKIFGNVVLRNRRNGDVFSSNARGKTKKVKKIFAEKGIPREQRGRIPVVCDDDGVVWIMGEGVSRRAAVGGETRKIWYIKVREE